MDDQRSQAQVARDRAIGQAVDVLVYLGVITAVSWAMVHRDYVIRLWMRIKDRPTPPDEQRIRRETAEFRRELSEIEHGGGPVTRPKGLYER